MNDIACHGKSSSAVGDVRESAFSMAGNTYRLHSILLHTGTANGGHYKAYVLDSGTGRWLECNSASVCELSSREEASLFLQASTVYTVHTEPESSDDAKVTEGNEKNSVLRSRSRESMKKFVTLRDDVLRENAYMFLYQKVSDDVVAKSLQNNDIAQGIYSEEEKNESNKLLEKCISAVPKSLAKKILEENADLQELRRLHEIHKKIVALKILFKKPTVNISSKVTAAKCSKKIRNSRDELQVVHQIVLSCETLNEIIHKVCPLLSLPLPSSSFSKSSPSTVSISTSASAIASGPAISQGHGDGQIMKGCETHHNNSLIKGNSISTQYYRLREFSEISRRKGATYGSRGDEPIASLGFSLLNTSITSHSPVVLLLEERTEDDPPFEEEIDQIMILRALVWSDELSGAMETTLDFLETLCRYFPSSNPYTDMDMDMDMDVEVDVNTDHTNTMSTIRNTMMEILVPGELTATLGSLREAVASQLNKSISEIILLVSSQSGDLIMECDQDHRSLGKAYGIKPGDLIFVEIGVPLTSPPSPSSTSPDSLTLDPMAPSIPESIALSALNRRLTSIVIYFNDPRDPTSSAVPQTDAVLPDQVITDSKARCADQNFLKVSPQTLLSDFKTLICKKLNIDLKMDDFYMSRNDSFSPSQLKDVSLSLHEAGLRNLGSVYLQASHMHLCMPLSQRFLRHTSATLFVMIILLLCVEFLFSVFLCHYIA